MIDDPREQAPTGEFDEDQMEQGGTPAEGNPGPRTAVKPNPGGTIQGSGDR